jgi:GNAT superfamily N-acetyltransferase
VAVRWRRRGVASSPARAAEQLAAARGHRWISPSHGASDHRAPTLYERRGYSRVELRPQRVRGTILLRGRHVEIDNTLIYLVKELAVDLGRSHSS